VSAAPARGTRVVLVAPRARSDDSQETRAVVEALDQIEGLDWVLIGIIDPADCLEALQMVVDGRAQIVLATRPDHLPLLRFTSDAAWFDGPAGRRTRPVMRPGQQGGVALPAPVHPGRRTQRIAQGEPAGVAEIRPAVAESVSTSRIPDGGGQPGRALVHPDQSRVRPVVRVVSPIGDREPTSIMVDTELPVRTSLVDRGRPGEPVGAQADPGTKRTTPVDHSGAGTEMGFGHAPTESGDRTSPRQRRPRRARVVAQGRGRRSA